VVDADSQAFVVGIDPDDAAGLVDAVVESNSFTVDACRTLYDINGTFVTCGGAELDCTCAEISAPTPAPTRPSRIRRLIDWLF